MMYAVTVPRWKEFFFRCRKSVKSLFFLLPLLGITNVLHFVWPNPLRGSWLSFAIWSITSHFLYSFQGVFVASVYFLFDDKVRMRKIITKMHLWLISNFRFSSDLLNHFSFRWKILCINSGFWKFVCEIGVFPIVSTILRGLEVFMHQIVESLNPQIWIQNEVSVLS